jgi:ribosomal protein L14
MSGPSSATISNPTASTSSVGSLVQGVYQFVLTVTDNQGATGKDTVTITVNAATDQPPVANAGLDLNITLPLNSVTLSGTGSDADGSIISYQWTKISGPSQYSIVSPSQSQTVVNNLVQGVYKFAFQVTDNNGVATSDTVQVIVNPAPPNLAPVANAGLDINVTLPTNTIVLNGSGTDADGTIASYQWTKVSGPSQYLVVSPSQAQTTVNNLLQGTYQFVLTVTDNQGAVGTDTVNVFVNPAPNQAPTANAGADIDITLPTNTATLNGSGNDADGSIAAYQWTKISGPSQFTISTPTRATATLSNLVQGVYQFELQVTDDQGATGKDTIIVTVHAAAPAPNQAPTANAGADLIITLPTNSVTLNGSGTDADGSIAAYQWTEISGPADDIVSPTQARTTVTNLIQGVYLFQLTVTDNNGATGSDTIQVLVNPSNQPPTANAGADLNITLPISSVTLNGSGSDPDGTIASYQWTMVSGPSTYTIVTPGQAQTTVNNLAQGVYQFQLTVTDNQGATGRDTVSVVVNTVPNQSPTANAGPDITITLPTNSVTLNGSGNDADGSVASYKWTKISGPNQYTIGSATKAQTTVSNLVQGVYKFELKVTDNKSATGADTVTVTVNAAPNQPPKANAGPDVTITLPTNSATLTGSGSDADGSIASYLWTKISGPTQYTIRSATQAKASLSGLVQGVYQFELKVTDNSGAIATDTMILTVNPGNQPPVANAGANVTITLPTNTVTLNGSGSDADGTIVSYQWTRISGPGQYSIASPTLAQTNVNNLVQGTYQFQLRVTDNNGATGTAAVTVTVNAAPNQPPTANAGSNIVITLPTNSVTLSGSGTDPDGSVTSYQWTKVSGPTQYTIVSSGQRQTAVNNLVQGVYQFQLKVTDNKGATGTATMTVTVNAAPNQAPTANAGADITITLPTNSVTLTGSGTDADGTIASYQWTKVSGPTQYTVATPAQAQTVVNNLVQGVYQFQLQVTDNQGAIGTATVTVIVNAAPNQYPTANAGTDITITLPTNTVTLDGSGNDPDGTIASYQWSKVSGPSQFTIANPGQAQTSVNNLVQGVYQFELKVTDNQGAVATSTITVTVNAAANQPPTANTGNDITITLPTNSVTLNGSGSDPDGTITSYQWTKISGPAQFTIASPAQAQTVVNNLVQGVYQFQLQVTDNQGATGTATITVTVNAAPNQPPTANAGADITITLPTNNVILSGSGTDPDGTIVFYGWRNVSGPPQFTIVNANQAQTAVNNLTQGVYEFELTVTDNSGAMATDTVIVTVNSLTPPTNKPPVANAGSDITISLPTDSVTLNGSGTDSDGTITSYKWINIAGPFQFNVVNSAQAQTKVTGLVAGVYEFELQVTDNAGATGSDTVFVTVNPASVQTFNQDPEANAGPDINITLPNNSAILAGSGSDPNGLIASYQWRKISGPSGFMASSMRDPQLTLSNLAAGVYQFELLVTDSAGRFAKDTANVTVNAKLNSKAKIYPNPATNMINVQISSTTPTNYTSIRIYDSKGNIVYRENFERTQQTVTRQINVSTFINGVYYLELNIDDNTMTTLIFVKQ